jgi:predicted ATPase
VHRAARIAAAGHGGQVLVSRTTRALSEGGLPSGVTLIDLGAHRLKDLDEPEELAQLSIAGLDQHFPAIRSLEPPTALPAELTTFVGRGREIGELSALLETARLVTLTGPGGTGKTRLVIRLAGALAPTMPDGAFFVDLAVLSDTALVAPTIARTLGLTEPLDRVIVDDLRAYLEPRALLLVLDNFEHLLDARTVVGDLLAAAPRLRIVVTSRAVLNLVGEHEYRVEPLELPDAAGRLDAEGLDRFEAIKLFAERARAVDPRFAVTDENGAAVAGICIRLDGLPLAIELAASRVRVLEPHEILTRLEHKLPVLATGPSGSPLRQQTLTGAIDWSYELLPAEHRVFFTRLAVFAGGCTVEAADVVCNPDRELGIDTFDGLAALVDHSLVRHSAEAGESRFAMLETIRDFGQARLVAEGDPARITTRHTTYFVDLATDAEGRLIGIDQVSTLGRFDREHANLRAVLTRCLESGDIETGLRLASALWRFWQQRGYLREGRRWLEALLGSPAPGLVAPAVRMRGSIALGGITYWLDDADATERAYEAALALALDIGDQEGEAAALYNLAFVPIMRGDVAEARKRFERSLEAAVSVSRPDFVALSESSLGIVLSLAGDDRAIDLLQEALAYFRASGNRFHIAWTLAELGSAELLLGRVEAGKSRIRESMEMQADAMNLPVIGAGMEAVAGLESRDGQHPEALRLMGAVEALRANTGAGAPRLLTRSRDVVAAGRDALGDRAADVALAEGRSMSLDEAIAFTIDLLKR